MMRTKHIHHHPFVQLLKSEPSSSRMFEQFDCLHLCYCIRKCHDMQRNLVLRTNAQPRRIASDAPILPLRPHPTSILYYPTSTHCSIASCETASEGTRFIWSPLFTQSSFNPPTGRTMKQT